MNSSRLNNEQSLQRFDQCGASMASSKMLTSMQMPIALAHASMFEKPGSYHTIEHPSGYPLFLILGKDHVLRGFHNVCRHRAYPVIASKLSGCSLVLGCKYHGWSYDVKGKLVKAPKFDKLEGFDKKSNSLFEVHVRVDDSGAVFVDVGSKPSPTIARVDVNKFKNGVVETWESEGQFNWKVAGMLTTLVALMVL
jgi:phenylpropionate dioxygenase-like ring-hydroxylating dioxygenase large terminal subunit